MHFLPPIQQRQSSEGTLISITKEIFITLEALQCYALPLFEGLDMHSAHA